jgi:hypothetical protein
MPKFKAFKERVRELNLLDALWQDTNATILVLYDRRRVREVATTSIKERRSQNDLECVHGDFIMM